MKKNILVKIMALGLAVVTALTPVTANAAEKKVVTRAEYDAAIKAYSDEAEEAQILNDLGLSDISYDEIYVTEQKKKYALVKSLNGCYQENGLKIYTVLNDSFKTFTKTGKYSIVAGGTTVDKDEGDVYFKAPKAGTYKFTITADQNVIGGNSADTFFSNGSYGYKTCKLKYRNDSGKWVINPNYDGLLLHDPAASGAACNYKSSSVFDNGSGYSSVMTKITITCKMKKGQKAQLKVRSSDADLDEKDPAYAYNFVGLDLEIKKIK